MEFRHKLISITQKRRLISMWDSKSRPNKDKTRQIATRKTKNAAYKVALFMPSKECLCIKQALANGTIDRNTYVIIIERNSEYIPSICEFLKNNFKRAYWFNGPLETCDLSNALKHKEKIDYAFFDICGFMTVGIAKWIYEFSGSEFAIGAKIFFTFASNVRNTTIKNLWNSCYNDMTMYSKYDIDNFCFVQLCKNELKASNIFESLQENMLQKRHGYGWYFTLTILFAAVNKNYSLEIQSVIPYCDSKTPMQLIEFTLGKYDNKFNSKTNILKNMMVDLGETIEERRNIIVQKSQIMVKAGKKAWETRRHNALKKKQSDAAYKAWETRRKNGNG